MTVMSFVIMALIVGAVFYAWYYFVHRDGVYDASRVDDDASLAKMRGTNRLRTTNSALRTEVGTIGEREEREHNPQDTAETPNLSHEQSAGARRAHMTPQPKSSDVETGRIGDAVSTQDVNFYGRANKELRADAEAAFKNALPNGVQGTSNTPSADQQAVNQSTGTNSTEQEQH